MREATVRRGPLRFSVRRFGRRGPHIVMLHGLASSQRIWDLVVPRLEKRFRVTTFDQRGHGESSKPSSGYSFDEVGRDLSAVLRAVRATRIVLVGHSYGANVAIDYASRYPREVAGVVCVDGGMGSMSERMDWATAREMLAPPTITGAPIEDVLEMVKANVGPRWSPSLEPIKRSMFHIDARGHVKPRLARANHMRILRAMYDQRPKELLARLACPTLMYCARPRAHVMDSEGGFYEMKRDSVKRIRGTNPKVTIEWITSIHDIPLDRPRELGTRIARFAREEVKA